MRRGQAQEGSAAKCCKICDNFTDIWHKARDFRIFFYLIVGATLKSCHINFFEFLKVIKT